MKIAILLFDNFETLDGYGPVEIFGRVTDLYAIKFYSLEGGEVRNSNGVAALTEKLESIDTDIEVFLCNASFIAE